MAAFYAANTIFLHLTSSPVITATPLLRAWQDRGWRVWFSIGPRLGFVGEKLQAQPCTHN